MGIRYSHCWELGTRPRLVGEEAKKGGWGAERTAGNLQENLVAGNVVNKIAEGKQSASCCWEGLPRKRGQAEGGVNLCEISLFLLSSPEFEKQVFSYIMVATKEEGAHLLIQHVFFSNVKDKSVGQLCH